MTGSKANVVAMAVLAGAAAMGAAQGKTMPDAQIESNVLKALAGAPELATQNIQTSTVYGTVTLTGTVHDEAMRSKAENLVARADGVKKVVDQLALGDAPAGQGEQAAYGEDPAMANMAGGPPQDANGQPLQSQADGSYAPAPPPTGATADNQPGSVPYGNAPYDAPSGRQPMYSRQGPPPQYGQAPPPPGYGQRAGIPVVVPPGAVVRIRINRGIDSNHIKPGTPFDGIVMNDILADGTVAIPRGASVFGVVADAQKTKALSGRGELALQLTGVNLGGQTFPMQTEVWAQVGHDKTASTVNHAVGLGVLGAVVGGLTGGGAGAAIGAGVGAGVGVAASAGGPNGRILIAPESLLTFRTNAPTPVQTVSQQEMQRLAYAAGPDPGARPRGYYRHGYYYPYAPAPGAVVVVR